MRDIFKCDLFVDKKVYPARAPLELKLFFSETNKEKLLNDGEKYKLQKKFTLYVRRRKGEEIKNEGKFIFWDSTENWEKILSARCSQIIQLCLISFNFMRYFHRFLFLSSSPVRIFMSSVFFFISRFLVRLHHEFCSTSSKAFSGLNFVYFPSFTPGWSSHVHNSSSIMFTPTTESTRSRKKFHICAQSFAWLISTNELKISQHWNTTEERRDEEKCRRKKSLQFFFRGNCTRKSEKLPNTCCRLTQINWIVNTEENNDVKGTIRWWF